MALRGESAGQELAVVAEAYDGDLELGFGVEAIHCSGFEVEGLGGVEGADEERTTAMPVTMVVEVEERRVRVRAEGHHRRREMEP